MIYPKPKLGRPRAGSENERLDSLLDHALKIFMRDGYGLASIGKIASDAGISTRTIYERFKNKGDLMVASVARMVERDVDQMQSIEGLEDMAPDIALSTFGKLILDRVTSPELIAFCRMGVAESARFPELASKMQSIGPQRIQRVISNYLAKQVKKELLVIDDTDKAATMFCHMLIAEPRHKALMGLLDKDWDSQGHIHYVVSIFLHGISKTKSNNETAKLYKEGSL